MEVLDRHQLLESDGDEFHARIVLGSEKMVSI